MARGKIASLFIGLGANTAELDKGLGRSKKKLKSFGYDVTEIGKVAAKSFAAITAASGAALVGIYKSSAPAIDQMGKLSRQVGLTVGELQSLRHASELNGVSQGNLDKSIEKFVKNLGDAKAGIGTAKTMLDKMGISAENLANLGTNEAIKVVADEISGLSNEAEKAALSTALFGRNGGAMVNVFENGREAIEQASKELESYGILLTELDVHRVEASNDAWTRIGSIMKSLGQIITVEVAPYVEALANHFLKAGKSAGGFRGVVVSSMDSVVSAVGFVGDTIAGLNVVWQGVKVAANFAIADMVKAISNFDIALTKTLNHIPLVTAEINQDLDRIRLETLLSYQTSLDELNALMSDQRPSEKLKESLAEIKNVAVQAANEMAQVRAEAKAKQVSLDSLDFSAQLDQDIENHNATEEELKRHLAVMTEINDPGTEEDIENYSYRIEQERNFQAELNDIVSTGLHARNQFEKASFKAQFQSVAGNLAATTAQAAQHDKKMFKINKMANIANAVMNTYTGVSKTLATYPQPLASIMAAIHLAAGIAQVKAIKNQSFGSSSMSSSAVGGAPVNVPTPNLETSTTEESQAQQGITIIVNGNILDKTGLEDLVQEATQNITGRDGLLFGEDTAQAQLVAA